MGVCTQGDIDSFPATFINMCLLAAAAAAGQIRPSNASGGVISTQLRDYNTCHLRSLARKYQQDRLPYAIPDAEET